MNPEVDLEGGHTFRPPSLTGESLKNGLNPTVDEGRSKDNKEFVALMKTVSEKHRDQGEVCVEKTRVEFENIASDEGTSWFCSIAGFCTCFFLCYVVLYCCLLLCFPVFCFVVVVTGSVIVAFVLCFFVALFFSVLCSC